MTTLLELKEYIKRFYSKNEVFVDPIGKFLLAFVMLLMINGNLGYMSRIDSLAIVLIVALMCSFLPSGFTIVFGALFILLHLYSLAWEVAAVVGALFLVMVLLYFTFSPKDAVVVVLLPICFLLKIPYLIPIAVGLLATPASVAAVACGTIVYYMVSFVKDNATSLGSMEASEAVARVKIVIDNLIGNKAMLVTVIAFSVTVIVVYMIRRLSIDHAWTIASIAGALLDAIILLIGDLMFDTNISIMGVILGTLISLLLVKVIDFFMFNLDYSRTEKVQFEDDEYYYYVKAVPKITVATPAKTVKKINTRHHSNSKSRNAEVYDDEQYYSEDEIYYSDEEYEEYEDVDSDN